VVRAILRDDQNVMRNRQKFAAPYPKQRRYRRFDLEFPVHLSFPSAGTACELHTISRNVSIGGLLLEAKNPPPTQTQVSLTIEVKGPRLRRSIRLQGEGKVVRVERLKASAGFAIAIECKCPIAEIENHLPATG
jgi:PilZ domain-containing protein